METKRLSTEVLGRLAKIDKSELNSNNEQTMNKLAFDVFNELLDEGHDVVISKTDLTMLFSLNIDIFRKTINDKVFKNTQAATPIT